MIPFLKQSFSKNKPKDFKVVRAPFKEIQKKILLVLIFVLAIIASFYAGEYWTSQIAYDRDALRTENIKIKELLEQEKLNVAAANVKAEIGHVAIEQVRESNSELLLQISDLERDLTYYQRVMNPINNDKGLRIDTFEIEKTSDANRFRLNLVLTQVGKKNSSAIQGVFDFSLEGSEQGLKKIYKLEELKLADKDLPSKFRFRYYQEISEEFILPENFVVERIHARATSTGAKSMTVEKTKTWSL